MELIEFMYSNPTRVIFGAGAVGQNLAFEVGELGLKKVLVVTDKNVAAAGLLEGVEAALAKAGAERAVFDGVEPNPSVETVAAAAETYKSSGCDGAIAVGGGSSMDCAKMALALAAYGGNLMNYMGLGAVPGPIPPLIAIPTTAGTGSEVTFFALATDRGQRTKLLMLSDKIAPRLAIVDPKMSRSLPPFQTAATGMDAMTHCIESLVSLKRDPVSEPLALAGIQKISQNLRAAVADGENMVARDQMALAATLGGMAFNNPAVAGSHAVSHALGGLFGVPHGIGCAMALPLVMEHNFDACADIFARVAAALGLKTDSMSAEEAARGAIAEIRKLESDIGIPKSLANFEIDASEAPTIVEKAMYDGAAFMNPMPFDEDSLGAIVKGLF